ncbi:hypothetical protein OH77DRAFT_292536 [Trametes cingulata]|nr:hypothetical protein OH77DRAFT_292536 [Trametes cingulata]
MSSSIRTGQEVGSVSIFWAFVVTTLLYPVVAFQVWAYARRYPADRCSMKSIVLFLVLSSTTQEALIISNAWRVLVKSVDVEDVAITRTTAIQFLLDSSIIAVVQIFYAHRIWCFSRTLKKHISALLGVFGLVMVVAIYAISFVLFVERILPQNLQGNVPAAALALVLDTLIAVNWCLTAALLFLSAIVARRDILRNEHSVYGAVCQHV